MDKKLLIGSIGAAVILILVSFTSVVGFQSTKIDVEKVSPLYSTRAARAQEKKNNVDATYVGKDKKPSITLPEFKKINNMFDKIGFFLDNNDLSIDKVQNAADKIRKNPQLLQKAKGMLNNLQKLVDQEELDLNNDGDSPIVTVAPPCPTTFPLAPLCFIILLPFLLVFALIYGATFLFTVLAGCFVTSIC